MFVKVFGKLLNKIAIIDGRCRHVLCSWNFVAQSAVQQILFWQRNADRQKFQGNNGSKFYAPLKAGNKLVNLTKANLFLLALFTASPVFKLFFTSSAVFCFFKPSSYTAHATRLTKQARASATR